MRKTHKKTFQIAIASTLAALSLALDLLSLKGDFTKFTIYALPLLLAGTIFGPVIGAFAGIAEGFLSQLITYGLTPTTILWILAPLTWGLISGLIAKIYKFKNTPIKIFLNVIITSLIVVFVNSLALILDGLIAHYPTEYVYTMLLTRIITSIIVGIFYTICLIIIIPRFQKKPISKIQKDNIETKCEVINNNINLDIKIKK